MSRQNLLRDVKGKPIQAFVPDPAKSSAPAALAGTLLLGTIFDIEDTIAISIRSDAAITRYFNSDSTFLITIPADTTTIVMLDETVTEVTLTGTATVEIEAM